MELKRWVLRCFLKDATEGLKIYILSLKLQMQYNFCFIPRKYVNKIVIESNFSFDSYSNLV